MKKVILIIFIFLNILTLTSCTKYTVSDKEITCQDIMEVYEEAGFKVEHRENTSDYDYTCYVKCIAPDSDDYIFFNIFDTAEEAKDYAKEREWNLILYFYTLVLNEPTWLTTKSYNNIEIEYDHNYLYEPFKELINS